MKIKSFLSQVLEQTDLTPVEKVKILVAKLKDIDVQFTSTISDLSQHHQMMTNWYALSLLTKLSNVKSTK